MVGPGRRFSNSRTAKPDELPVAITCVIAVYRSYSGPLPRVLCEAGLPTAETKDRLIAVNGLRVILLHHTLGTKSPRNYLIARGSRVQLIVHSAVHGDRR